MKKVKTPYIVLVLCILYFLFPGTIPSFASDHLVVNQGDKVTTEVDPPFHVPLMKNIKIKTTCTLGYVNQSQNNALYAGHCSHGHVGVKVKNMQGDVIGEVVENPYHDNGGYIPGIQPAIGTVKDWAYINISPSVSIGKNSYSGDDKAKVVASGETICSYGSRTDMTHCGRVITDIGYAVIATRSAGGYNGDSGGPAWTKDGEFVGVFSLFGPGFTVFSRPAIH